MFRWIFHVLVDVPCGYPLWMFSVDVDVLADVPVDLSVDVIVDIRVVVRKENDTYGREDEENFTLKCPRECNDGAMHFTSVPFYGVKVACIILSV